MIWSRSGQSREPRAASRRTLARAPLKAVPYPWQLLLIDFSDVVADLFEIMAVPARLELATFGLGNRCSIRLSYGTTPPGSASASHTDHG
jgi:hypothetical protein